MGFNYKYTFLGKITWEQVKPGIRKKAIFVAWFGAHRTVPPERKQTGVETALRAATKIRDGSGGGRYSRRCLGTLVSGRRGETRRNRPA